MQLLRSTFIAALVINPLALAAAESASVEPPLRYRFEPGVTQTYKMSKSMDVTTAGTPTPTKPIHAEPAFAITLRTVELLPGGDAVVDFVITSWVEPGSKEQPIMTSPRQRCTISPFGVMRGLARADPDEPTMIITNMSTSTPVDWSHLLLQETLLFLFPVWPEKPAAGGKYWDAGRADMATEQGAITYLQTARISDESGKQVVLDIRIEGPKTTITSTIMRNTTLKSMQDIGEHPPGSAGWEPFNITNTVTATGNGKAHFSRVEGRMTNVEILLTQLSIPDLTALADEANTPEKKKAVQEMNIQQEIKTRTRLEWIAPAAQTK